MTPLQRKVCLEVIDERDRQDALWGPQPLPSVPSGFNEFWTRVPTECRAKVLCEDADRRGTLTHAHIVLEELAEAYSARTPRDMRGELVQLAACVVKWIEQIDQNIAPPFDGIEAAQQGKPL